MDKSCKRCESEAKLEGLTVGQKCLDGLRAELAGYDEILTASELDRLGRERDELANRLGPEMEELSRIEARIEELLGSEKDRADEEILRAENTLLEAEAKTAEELARQVETKIVGELAAEELAAETELLEIRKLEVELAETVAK